jgi:hypothetical protein
VHWTHLAHLLLPRGPHPRRQCAAWSTTDGVRYPQAVSSLPMLCTCGCGGPRQTPLLFLPRRQQPLCPVAPPWLFFLRMHAARTCRKVPRVILWRLAQSSSDRQTTSCAQRKMWSHVFALVWIVASAARLFRGTTLIKNDTGFHEGQNHIMKVLESASWNGMYRFFRQFRINSDMTPFPPRVETTWAALGRLLGGSWAAPRNESDNIAHEGRNND